MNPTPRPLVTLSLALALSLLAACSHRTATTPPHDGGPRPHRSPATKPGMVMVGRVLYNQQHVPIYRNEILLFSATGPATRGNLAKQEFDVLVGAYPQATGGGTLAVLNEDITASLAGEVYAYLKGVRPITVTKRIRTYSPATEVALWCRDGAYKDFVFAYEGSTKVTIKNPSAGSPASMDVPQGYCVRVYGNASNTAYFKDTTPLLIESLKASSDPELVSMYEFYLNVYGYAAGAGLNPSLARAQSPVPEPQPDNPTPVEPPSAQQPRPERPITY